MSVTDRWFSSGTSAFPTIETDCYDITEMLLKVALNTINHLTAICNMPMENWNRHINEGTDCIDWSRNISHMHFNVFVPAATCLCLSQALTWICIVIYHGLLYVQLVEGRCDCLFCWYWWDCLPSLLKRFFPIISILLVLTYVITNMTKVDCVHGILCLFPIFHYVCSTVQLNKTMSCLLHY